MRRIECGECGGKGIVQVMTHIPLADDLPCDVACQRCDGDGWYYAESENGGDA